MSPTPLKLMSRRMDHPARRTRRSGLTLIEGTMSVFVAGVALTLAVQSYYVVARWQRQLEVRELAGLEASNVLEHEFQRLAEPQPFAAASSDAAGVNRREVSVSEALAAALPGAQVVVQITAGDAELGEQRIQVTVAAPGDAESSQTWATLTAWHFGKGGTP